jgi:calcium-dependent protein kinase
MSNKSEEK